MKLTPPWLNINMPPSDLKIILKQALEDNRIKTSHLDALKNYLELLQQWNQVFNLTAIRDPKEMVYLHILDSLSILPYLYGTRLIDVGTGAGLPGIPLALMCSEKNFVLLDSNNKKTRFLTQVVSELKIKNIEIVQTRCEEFQVEKKFDCVISRAFTSLKNMVEKTQHLLKEQGQFLAMKGVYPEQEIQEIPQGVKLIDVHKIVIQGLEAQRCLVCLGLK